LGFGSSQADAVGTAEVALGDGFKKALNASTNDWVGYDATRRTPPKKLPGLGSQRVGEIDGAYYVNANVLKASEDKTFPGAIVASMTSPWGPAISAGDPANTYFGSYREVF